MINFYARSKFVGMKMGSVDQIKERIRLARYPHLDRKEVFEYYQLDHIVPFSISMDSSESNLQILTRAQHSRKSTIDRMIIAKLKEMKWVERGIGKTIHLLKPKEDLVKEYIKLFNEYTNQSKNE